MYRYSDWPESLGPEFQIQNDVKGEQKMKVTLKDGTVKEYAQSMSVYDIAKDISEGLARAACAGEVNGEVVDLRTVVEEDCVFVMGDNRNNSRDSRSPDIGQIDRREILGKAILLMLPGTDGGLRQRDFSRIGVIG